MKKDDAGGEEEWNEWWTEAAEGPEHYRLKETIIMRINYFGHTI
jgi:hypothetical protein